MEPQETVPTPAFDDYLLNRAEILVDNDTSYIESLVALRKANGLSTFEVANRVSVSEETIIDLESYHSDPKLSLLRRYAHAVNAIVKHSVIMDPDDPNYSSTGKESSDGK
jgi:DNA-binding XRE family transcriptional regulator